MGGATSLGQYGASHIFSLKYTTSSDVQLRSISIAVIQLARLSGFSPIITTASAHNAKFLQSIGANLPPGVVVSVFVGLKDTTKGYLATASQQCVHFVYGATKTLGDELA